MIRPFRRFSSELNFIKSRVLQQDLISSQYSASNHSLLPFLYSVPSLTNNILYLLTEHSSRSLFLVDPGDVNAALEAIEQIKFNFQQLYILKTHSHSRHSAAILDLLAQFPNCSVVEAKFKNTLKQDEEKEKEERIILLNEAETISVGEFCVSCLYTPGHSADHISFVVTHVTPDSTKIPILFSGDSLRIGGVAPNKDESVFSAYYASIQKMFYLPEQTLVFPGHEDTEENLKFAEYLETRNELISGKLESV